jgi:hypothetical protein
VNVGKCVLEEASISKPTHLQKKCKEKIPTWNPKK